LTIVCQVELAFAKMIRLDNFTFGGRNFFVAGFAQSENVQHVAGSVDYSFHVGN
jgi:hypothetical protein